MTDPDAPTLDVLRAWAISAVQDAIDAEERTQDRALREVVQALLAATAPDTVPAAKLSAVADRIAYLRGIRAAMAAAETAEALAAITWA